MLLCLLVLGLNPPPAGAEPGPMRAVESLRLRESFADGVLLEARLTPDQAPRFEVDDPLLDRPAPFLLRVSIPEDLVVRIEAGPPDLLAFDSGANRSGSPRPLAGILVREESAAVVIRRGSTSVRIGLEPFSLRMTGPASSLSFGDASTSPALAARWDTPSGGFFDAWVRIETSTVGRHYGGFPRAAGLNNLFLDGSDLAFLGPDRLPPPVAGTHPPPPPPISPVVVSTNGWALRIPPTHTLSVDLRDRFEIGVLESALDFTFALAPARTAYPRAAARATTAAGVTASSGSTLLEDLLHLALGSAWIPEPPSGIALDPAFSRDSQTPGPALAALYIRSRALDIPANVLLLEEWRGSPELVFRRAIPGPGDTYGLAALEPESAGPQVSRMIWSGSLAEGFPSLRRTLRSALVAGLSGLPAVGYDFHSLLGRSGEEADPLPPDLYRRWTQLLAFSPTMRMHGRRRTHEPWLYSDPAMTAQFRDYAWIHVNLKPYLEEVAARARAGRPMMRAPVLAWPEDRETWNLDDAYLLGPDLYVAPILDAGATARAVYLPAGSWYDFWSDGLLAGGRWLPAYPAPQENIPVFVRAGAVLPLALDPSYGLSEPIRDEPRLTLRFYPDARGEAAGEMESDAGRVAAFLLTARNGTRTIRVAPTRDTVTLWIPGFSSAPRSVRVLGRALRPSANWAALDRSPGWLWDPRFQRVLVRLPPGPGRTVTIGR